MFDVKVTLLDSCEALLEVQFEDQTVKEAMVKAAKNISRQVDIHGFRRGFAPYDKVVRHVGEAAITEEAADDLLKEHYGKIIEEAKITAYGPGEFVEMKPSPLWVKFRVPLEPKVTLGDYRSLRQPWEEAVVNDVEVDGVLEQLRQDHVVLTPVERATQMDDQVVIDVEGKVNGEVIVDEDDIPANLTIDRPFLSSEFTNQLIGLSTGESRTFTTTLPMTLETENLRGATADFTVKVKSVLERTLPDLDDALASTVGSFETLDALKQSIRNRLQASKSQQAHEAYRSALVTTLVEQAEIAYPPLMLQETLDEMVSEIEERIKRQENKPLEDYLRLQRRTMADLRNEITPSAQARVKRSLVLATLAKQEGITVNEDEVVRAYDILAESAGMEERWADQNLTLDSQVGHNMRSTLFGRKTLERLEQIGRGLADEIEPAEEPAQEAPAAEAAAAETETEVQDTASEGENV